MMLGTGLGFGPPPLFWLLFVTIFVICIGTFLYTLIAGVRTWHRNNNSPRLTVSATVVTKRMEVHHHHHTNAGNHSGAHGYHTTSSTWYYVTFQVESGDRMELSVTGSEYGLLVEGDAGQLSFQGTRYLGFEHNR